MNRTKKLLVWTAVACASTGLALAEFACGGPTLVVQQYSGAQRSGESIAVIRMDGSDTVQIRSIDREQLGAVEKGLRVHVEVLPGMHEIDVTDPGNHVTLRNVRFVAEAGKVYRVRVAQTLSSGGSDAFVARVYEVDRSSDAQIREASLPPVLRRPAERPRADAGAPEPRADTAALSDGGIEASATDAAGTVAARD
jgi:hypothetical protein